MDQIYTNTICDVQQQNFILQEQLNFYQHQYIKNSQQTHAVVNKLNLQLRNAHQEIGSLMWHNNKFSCAIDKLTKLVENNDEGGKSKKKCGKSKLSLDKSTNQEENEKSKSKIKKNGFREIDFKETHREETSCNKETIEDDESIESVTTSPIAISTTVRETDSNTYMTEPTEDTDYLK